MSSCITSASEGLAKGLGKKENTMGLAASQSRLLSLTSRMHDLEYKGQNP